MTLNQVRNSRVSSAGRVGRSWLYAMVMGFLLLSTPHGAWAAPSQNDVFKSIQDSMGKQQESDSRPLLLLLCGGGVIVLLVVVGNRRQQKAAAPGPLNHPGKLLKEVLREVPLKSAEMKQLKLLADAVNSRSGEEAGPLTLLLCPSLMAKGLKEPTPRLDRKAIAQVVRKLRLGQSGGNP